MGRSAVLYVWVMLASVVAWSQATHSTNKSSGTEAWSTYSGDAFTISYPDSFKINTSGIMDASLFIFSKQTSREDLFRENVNIIVQDLTGQNIALDQYVEKSEEQIKTYITNSSIIDSRRVKTSRTEYHKVVFTGIQGQYDLKFVQHYFMKGEVAYVVTFTCERSEFEKYDQVSEEIMSSFKIVK